MYPGEVLFVPDPEGSNEDDGVLVSCVYDGIRDEIFLLVLQGTDLTEVARAYAGVPL